MIAARILLVEDESALAGNLSERLQELGHTVVGKTATSAEAVLLAAALRPDLILADVRLAGPLDSITTARHIREHKELPVVIYLTAHAADETLLQGRAAEPLECIRNPWNDQELRSAIEIGLSRRDADKRRRESEQRSAAVLNSIGDGVLAVDRQGKVTLVNPVAERLTGWPQEEAAGKPIEEVFILLDGTTRLPVANPVLQILQTGTVASRDGSTVLVARGGREMLIEMTAAVIQGTGNSGVQGAVLTCRDISRRKEVEEALRNAEKVESLGLLVGGLAHVFNNLLTPVLGCASILAAECPADSPSLAMLREIEQSARRGTELTHQLLACAGKGQVIVGPLDLSALVREMTPLLMTAVSKTARLELDLAPQSSVINADADQVRQLLVEVVTNASEALGEPGGVITIRTAVRQCGEEQLRSPHLASGPVPGQYVVLEVADTGCGMSAEMVKHIFDPFFTTRFTGRGLGLAAVLGIIRSLRGTIQVRSEVGKGSVFEILLPRFGALIVHPQTNPAAAGRSGQRTVLIVDDEESIRFVIRYTLEKAGLKVLEAAGGRQAIALLGQQGAAIDVVLLDLTMPDLDGRETLTELRRIKADVPVILMSGYSSESVSEHFSGQTLAGIIQKPFRPAQLVSQVVGTLKS